MAAAGVTCHLCREHQMEMECCRGGLLLPRGSTTTALSNAAGGEGEEEEDRLSALPNDLLLRILAGLRCARAAAHTGLLARRWRGLWARLPDLTFHRIAPAPLHAVLAMVAAGPAPALLDIDLFSHHELETAALLAAAAAVAPAELVVNASWSARRTELPCFDRATSIKLDVYLAGFTLPPRRLKSSTSRTATSTSAT